MRPTSASSPPASWSNVAPTADGGVEALAVIQSSSAEAGDIRVGAPDGPRASLLDLPYALG